MENSNNTITQDTPITAEKMLDIVDFELRSDIDEVEKVLSTQGTGAVRETYWTAQRRTVSPVMTVASAIAAFTDTKVWRENVNGYPVLRFLGLGKDVERAVRLTSRIHDDITEKVADVQTTAVYQESSHAIKTRMRQTVSKEMTEGLREAMIHKAIQRQQGQKLKDIILKKRGVVMEAFADRD